MARNGSDRPNPSPQPISAGDRARAGEGTGSQVQEGNKGGVNRKALAGPNGMFLHSRLYMRPKKNTTNGKIQRTEKYNERKNTMNGKIQ